MKKVKRCVLLGYNLRYQYSIRKNERWPLVKRKKNVDTIHPKNSTTQLFFFLGAKS